MKTGIYGLSIMRSFYVLCEKVREMRNVGWIWGMIHIIQSFLAQICCNKNTRHCLGQPSRLPAVPSVMSVTPGAVWHHYTTVILHCI